MSSKFKKMAKKATSILVSLTTTVWLAGLGTLVPFAAQADATTDALNVQIQRLLAQVTALQAQLSALGGSSSSSAAKCSFTRSLAMKSKGDDVKCLQSYLMSTGDYTYSGGATGFFGSVTKAAVMAWQKANSVSPASGYFGPISQAKYSAVVVVVIPPPASKPQCSDGIDNDGDGKIDYPADPDCTGANDTTESAVPTGTGLTVMAGDQPAATLAVQNAIHVPFTTFKLSASADGDVKVGSITVERTGLANDAVFSGIKLLDENMMPITSVAKTLNSTHQAVLTDNFIVPKGTTHTYYLAGNMASSLTSYAGQVAYLSLVAVTPVGGATVTGSLPIAGAGHTINATLSVGSATLAKGTMDPNTSITKAVGTTAYIFSSIKATAGSAEDMMVKSIRWNQSGSAAQTDLGNVTIVLGTTEYPAVVSSDGKYYSATFGAGVLVKKGEAIETYVKADVLSGSNRTIDFDLYRYDDFVFQGATFKYSVQPSTSESLGSSSNDSKFYSTNPVYDASRVTIGTGTLRVEKSNTVEAGGIANGNTANLGAFLFDVSGEPVSFTSWVLTVTTTDNDREAAAEDMRITGLTVMNAAGAVVAGPLDLSRGVTTLTFTDTVTVPVGKNIYTIKGKLNNNWENNDTIIVGFNPSTALTSVKGQTTGNTLTPTPNATVNANTQSVKAGTLAVSIDTSLANQNYVKGGNGAELGRYILDASASGEDVKVTVLTLRGEMTTSQIDNFQNLQLFDGATALNTGSNVNNPSSHTAGTAYTLTFNLDSPGLIIPKGTTKSISLKGNLTTSFSNGDIARWDFRGLTNGDWGTSGVSTGTDITETFASSTAAKLTIQSQGGYSVAEAPSVPSEKWVTSGATGVTLNVLRFTSTTEPFALTDLRLQISTTGSSTGADFAKVYLYDGATLVMSKTPSFVNGVEDFVLPSSGTGTFIIPKDSYKELTIKADLATIGSNLSGTAGQLVGVDWDGATSSRQKATGKSSGISVHASTAADQTASGVVMFRSVPTVARLPIPVTTLTSGSLLLYKFQVTADPAYDVALRQFTFQVSTTGITGLGSSLASFTLRDATDGNKRVSAATGTLAEFYRDMARYSNTSGTLLFNIIADTTDETNAWVVIPAGQTHVFELRGNITTGASGNSITTKLLGDSARPPRVSLTGGSARRMLKLSQINGFAGVSDIDKAATASTTAFLWSDFSSDATTTHSANTADWMNSYKVPGILSTGLDPSTMSN